MEGDRVDKHDLLPHEAGTEFADLLLNLKSKGKLTAKDVCSLCWYASAAQIVGLANDMAMPPWSRTGHFQRKLDSVCGFGSKLEDGYTLQVPGCDRFSDDDRCPVDLPCLPMHEALQQEVDDNPSIIKDCKKKSLAGQDWSRMYKEHPVVRAASAEDVVFPIAIYSDGVAFSKRDGIHAFYAYNLVTGTRHLLMPLRKSDCCQCPCQKWCSFWPVWDWIRWSILALAEGKWPERRHDGSEFSTDEDQWRIAKGGGKLIKGAVVAIKADWLEFAATIGLTRWDNVEHPCFRCHCRKPDLTSIGNFSAITSPCKLKTAHEYDRACKDAEHWVTIPDRATLTEVYNVLEYDFRGSGNGRALTEAIPRLNLLANDRLAPCENLRDIGKFEDLKPPCRILFWRSKAKTIATKRCPVFCPEAGVTVETCMIDAMHTLHLGVYKDTCRTAVWCLISGDAWATGAGDLETLAKLGHLRLQQSLTKWYKKKKAHLREGEHCYEIGALTIGMIGTASEPCLAIKAAECGTFLEFCRDELRRCVDAVREDFKAQAAALLAVLEALVSLRDEMRWGPRILLPDQLQRLTDFASRAFTLREAAGIHVVPKWHLLLHLCHDAYTRGNPQHWTTFLDEDFNGKLRDMASALHRTTWSRRLLVEFRRTYISPRSLTETVKRRRIR